MRISKTMLWSGLLLIVLLILLWIWMWIIPTIRSHFTDSYVVRSKSLNVVAEYYPLTLDGIHRVHASGGSVVADGYDVRLLKVYNQPPVSRNLPQGFADLTLPDSSWHLIPALNSVTGFNKRTFVRSITQDTIEIDLPALNDEPMFSAYRGSGDSVLIVLGSSAWKMGGKAQLGYITGWPKRH